MKKATRPQVIAIVVLSGGLIIAGLVAAAMWYVASHPGTSQHGSGASDAQLRTDLACGRMTTDYRETDPYCHNLDLYRRLRARGIDFSATKPQSATITLALVVAAETAQPVANETVVVSETVQCIRAPCNPVGIWRGKTDELGVVEVPRDKLPSGATIRAGGRTSSAIFTTEDKAARAVAMYDKVD